jgi:dimethylhistidine N-methyltransferase
MNTESQSGVELHDYEPTRNRFRAEVLSGLRKSPKELPSKYLYDEQGSLWFDRITQLEEYYPTRTEASIMESYMDEMTHLIGPQSLLIEYGSGSSTKTRILLDHLNDPAGYVPIDISKDHLLASVEQLTSEYPDLDIYPVSADYTQPFSVPDVGQPVSKRVVYYPGSTIGNFDPAPAKHFLERIAQVSGPGGALLIGVDLKKAPVVLHNAYNDHEAVTAGFNLNMLERINRELDADFDIDLFKHYAFYNPLKGRVEMHLVSLRAQTVLIDGVSIPFAKGESIWTESSYKFTLEEFSEMAESSGFQVEHVWTDEREWFSIQYLTVV